MADRTATAVVPGVACGFFSPCPDDDPTEAGVRGAALALTDGVTVTVEPAAETAVSLGGARVELSAVERVLDALGVTARVAGDTPLPVGTGFGLPGGMALGTALAARRAFGLELSANELATVAHGADVLAGTGLGTVAAQAAGGVGILLEPGAPGRGRLDAVPARPRVEYVSLGETARAADREVAGGEVADVVVPDGEVQDGGLRDAVESVPEVPDGAVPDGDGPDGDAPDAAASESGPPDADPAAVAAAGDEALGRLVESPTLDRLLYASRWFARETGLLTPRAREAIEAVSAAGGDAAMALPGENVFALGTGLSDAGYDPSVCEVDPVGARLVE